MTKHLTEHPLDRITASYLRRCLGGDRALLDAVAGACVRLHAGFHDRWGARLLPRPVFIADSELKRFIDDLCTLFGLITSLPQRLFGGDLGRYCHEMGIDARRTALLTRDPDAPPMYGRADAYHDGTSFKLLEFNIGSEVGGMDVAQISKALLEVDAFREFADEHGLTCVHSGQVVADVLRQAAAHLTAGAEPVIAVIEPDNDLEPYLPEWLCFEEMMRGFGVDVLIGEVSQLRDADGRLQLHGRPVDVVLRYFTENEIVADPGLQRAVEPIFRAHEEGRVVLWTTLRSKLFANKGCLALLSDTRNRGLFSAEEAIVIDRVLPWTRTLADEPTEVDGASTDLLGYCGARRTELIIKPRASYRGQGNVAGWRVSDVEWKQALAKGVAERAVVQRRVVPRREPMVDPATGAVTTAGATWGVFITPNGYAGAHVLTLPLDSDGFTSTGGEPVVRAAVVFSYPAGTD